MKILVLLGGNSPEREVSIRSAASVSQALKKLGYSIEEYDTAQGYQALANFQDQIDAVFPILHGIGGEDGEVQKVLEKLHFKYLGSDSKASELAFDKVAFKQELENLGVLTPKWQIVTKDNIKQAPTDKPYVLKPIANGSAIDTFIFRNPNRQAYPADLFDRYDEMLFEELIDGPEITVAILDNDPLPIVEIIPPEGQEFDYENKYNGQSRELCPPVNIPTGIQLQAQQLTAKIHQRIGARHLSRTDIIVSPEGQLFVLDLNTMPGLTTTSLYPKAAQQAGLNMEQLIQKFLDLTLAS